MRLFVLALTFISLACGARAADQPVYSPPADWVKPTPLPETPGPDTGTPTRMLLEDMQVRFDGDARESYWNSAVKIQSSQGLSVVGNLTINWKPDTDSLTIHKVRILRGGETIDLLAGGRTFTVLRRENNLEMAMLDGTLTAAIQPEGLQVGDILELAFTLRRADPVMQGRSEWLTGNTLGVHANHLNIRGIWPSSKHLKWHQTDGLPEPKITSTQDGQELSIVMTDVQPIKPPKGAPVRYSEVGQLEGSEFQSWADVSALMEPLYQKASALAVASPLKAEAAKIKASSADPKVQAMAALKLVEDQIRYLFLGMNNGGYMPADADQTWSRRFGDCKGKTVVLLALLHELGIEAQPALANIAQGDGMDERLPMLEAFDHVLVRAVVGGKAFWLDGTRVGDRNLDDIPIPGFHWVLPVQKIGGALVKLTIPQPKIPFIETETHFDASAGLDSPAPMHATMVFRGDAAIFTKLKLASASRDDNERTLRDMWKKSYFDIDVKTVDYTFDEAAGEERVTMDGTANLSWRSDSTGLARRYEVDGAVLGWKPEFDRDPGPHVDAPFGVAYPFFNKMTETIVLPNGGAGFGVDGTTIDQTVAAWTFRRTAKIDKGVFTMEASTKALAPEFPAAGATEATTALRNLSDSAIYVRAPAAAFDMNKRPKTAQEFLARAARFGTAEQDKALADVASALRLDPHSAEAYGLRAQIYIVGKKFTLALAALDELMRLRPGNSFALGVRKEVLEDDHQYDRAAADLTLMQKTTPSAQYLLPEKCRDEAFSEKLMKNAVVDCQAVYSTDPTAAEALEAHALAYIRLGKLDLALTDYETILKQRPNSPLAHFGRGIVELRMKDATAGRDDIALARSADLGVDAEFGGYKRAAGWYGLTVQLLPDPVAYNETIKTVPEADRPALENSMHAAGQLVEKWDFDGAITAYDKLIQAYPNYARLWALRAMSFVEKGDIDRASRDLQSAEKLDSHDGMVFRVRGIIADRKEDYRSAADAFSLSLAAFANNSFDLLQRARAYQNLHETDKALADLEQISKLKSDFAEAYIGKARIFMSLSQGDKALAEADRFVAANSNSDASHELRGQTLKFLKRTDEADQEFSKSLALKPTMAAYLDRARLHYSDKPDQSLADIAEAARLDPKSPVPFITRAYFYKANGDLAKAIGEANSAVSLAPDDFQARTARSNFLVRNNQYDLAIQDIDHLLQKWPGNPVALNNRCWTRATVGKDLKLALADCNESIAKEANNPMTLDSRGFVRFRMGQFDQAIMDYDAALKLRPKEASSLFGRGLAELRKGATAQGQADLADARSADPKVDSQFADYGVKP